MTSATFELELGGANGPQKKCMIWRSWMKKLEVSTKLEVDIPIHPNFNNERMTFPAEIYKIVNGPDATRTFHLVLRYSE
jgi:hypothetical protein